MIDIVTCRILDKMDEERESNLSNWMTARNSRGNVPQYDGFRADWYEYETEYIDNMDRN